VCLSQPFREQEDASLLKRMLMIIAASLLTLRY
jgi:hypothetical protein